MISKKLFLISLVCVLTIFLIFCLLYFYKNYLQQLSTKNAEDNTLLNSQNINSPEITIKEITLKNKEADKNYEVTVTAKEGKFFYLPSTLECSYLNCILTTGQQVIAKLYADKALVNQNNKTVIFPGPVSGHFEDLSIRAENILYNFGQQTIDKAHNVFYYHPDFYLYAPNSSVQIKNNFIFMSGGVKSEFSQSPTGNNS
jgi:hypothetical protein